jgi:hypothetical protein
MIRRQRDDGGPALRPVRGRAGHDEIVTMAPAAIYSCLAKDTRTGVATGSELAEWV